MVAVLHLIKAKNIKLGRFRSSASPPDQMDESFQIDANERSTVSTKYSVSCNEAFSFGNGKNLFISVLDCAIQVSESLPIYGVSVTSRPINLICCYLRDTFIYGGSNIQIIVKCCANCVLLLGKNSSRMEQHPNKSHE